MWYLLCCLFLIGEVLTELDSRLVRISQGSIKGYKDKIEDVFVYYGIPYAKAPTGSQRFKDPLPPPAWLQQLEAVDKGIICPQFKNPTVYQEFVPKNKIVQEDCLIANIYVPNVDKKNIPVVVYIHGGGFIFGYGDFLTPKKLVSTTNIIAVTFNYRLGAHGFLCLGTKDIPGNAGMKDQVALLKWVKNNIKNFGGNPDEVTIAGYSAGAASVDLMLLSKMAKGLFKKVISESGANIAPFAVQMDPLKNSKEYAKLLGFENFEDVAALEEFYKTVPFDVLQEGNVLHRTDSELLTVPCVERDVGQKRFLGDSPANILKSGNYTKLPILYGFTDMEGALRVVLFDYVKDRMNEKFSDFMPADLAFDSEKEKEQVANRIQQLYFEGKPVANQTILRYINFFSDTTFVCPMLRSVKYQVQAENNEVYLYEYSYVDENTPLVPHTNTRGANHCAQTNAVMDGVNITNADESSIHQDFFKVKSYMRELWANFITTGKPESSWVPPWPPAGEDGSPHMSLKLTPELRGSLLSNRCRVWEEIYEKHYRHPVAATHPLIHTEL